MVDRESCRRWLASTRRVAERIRFSYRPVICWAALTRNWSCSWSNCAVRVRPWSKPAMPVSWRWRVRWLSHLILISNFFFFFLILVFRSTFWVFKVKICQNLTQSGPELVKIGQSVRVLVKILVFLVKVVQFLGKKKNSLGYGNFCLVSARLSLNRHYPFPYYFPSSFSSFFSDPIFRVVDY